MSSSGLAWQGSSAKAVGWTDAVVANGGSSPHGKEKKSKKARGGKRQKGMEDGDVDDGDDGDHHHDHDGGGSFLSPSIREGGGAVSSQQVG